MNKVISIIQEKGGCGKTTTALELAYNFSMMDQKVLFIDLDPQANATIQLTGSANHLKGIFDLLVDEEGLTNVKDIACKPSIDWQNIVLLPADRRLLKLEVSLQSRLSRESLLKDAIESVKTFFNIVIIDLPPTLGISAINALTASTHYIIPTDLSEYSRLAIPNVEKLVSLIRKKSNPNIKSIGVLMTGFEKGGSHAVRGMLRDLEEMHKDLLLDFRINHSVKVIESQRKRVSVSKIDPENSVSLSYKQLTQHILRGE